MDIVNAEKYYKQVQERFPDLSIKQIDSIVKYGLRSFVGHNAIGGDVLLYSNYFLAYCGKLFINQDIYQKYVLLKKRIKSRIKYRRTKKFFDGRYYFGLMKKDYKKIYLDCKKRNLKGMRLDKVCFFKSYDECTIFPWEAVFEVPRKEGKFCEWSHNAVVRKFNLIAKRDKNGKLQPVGKENSIWKKRA